MAGSRRLARQHAFVVICSLDSHLNISGSALGLFLTAASREEELAPDEKPLVPRAILEDETDFARALILGVSAHLKEIDEKIGSISINWSMDRMALIDRNILRLGVYELMFEEQTAVGVIINEAVELAKKFGEHSSIQGDRRRYSHHFVNGILDKVAVELGRTQPSSKKNRGRNNRRKR